MKKIFYLIILFLLSCSNKNNSEIKHQKEIVLGESFYSNGQIEIRVIKGRTLGEDTYLKIIKFDSLGKKITEYGSWHYGRKFKSTFKYNSDGTLSEESFYSFDTLDNSILFENYTETYHDYKLDDTTENYHGYISSKILRNYISDTIVEQYLELDSLTGSKKFIIIRTDTILKDEISY
jgi:hypothetical protein